MATTPRPRDLHELASLGVVPFDPSQPLRRYLGAVSQLIKESKVYAARGEIDAAFVYYVKVLKLTTDLLPHRHPEWDDLSSETRASIRKDSEMIAAQLSDLKKVVYERSKAWEEYSAAARLVETSKTDSESSTRSNTPTASSLPSRLSSLWLRNTVQPSTMSMETLQPPGDAAIQFSTVVEKKMVGGKFRRKFGVGRKAREVEVVVTSPTPARGAEDMHDWTMVQDGNDSGDYRRGESSTKGGKLPFPGEERLDFDPGIEYSGSSRTQPWAPSLSSPPVDRPPTQPPLSTPPLYGSWPHQPPQPQSYEIYHSSQLRPPPQSSLQRSPSRLTMSHQQQQGYSPSFYAPPTAPYPHPAHQYPSAPPPQIPRATRPSYFSQQSISSPSHPPYPPPTQPPLAPVLEGQTSRQSAKLKRRTPTYDLPPSAPPARPSIPPRLVRSGSLSTMPVGLIQPVRSSTMDHSRHSRGRSREEEEPFTKTEGGQPLRNVVISTELVSKFVALADSNTQRGIETCGLLMGTLMGKTLNRFAVTHLLIPKQEGTSDTCTTTHEEEQFAFQDERDLMTLGWIHTHPTQSCFMSSLDLHTHASYQVMLAEAIAIVCAPHSDPSFGIFRLTDPPGLETIVKCTIQGLFHPHPDRPIYTDCDHGHVQLRSDQKFSAVDLRSRR